MFSAAWVKMSGDNLEAADPAMDKTPSNEPRPRAAITGASSGIGAEFARALAGRNYDLILIARRLERLEQLAEDLRRNHGIDAGIMVADLGCVADLERVADRIAHEQRLELLINNAGFGVLGKFFETEAEAHVRMHRVHVLATLRLSHAALPGLIARNRGGIINVASVAGLACMPGHASYASSKAWMVAFSECLHLELRSAGSAVRVQALCPGYTYSEFHDLLGLDRKVLMPDAHFWMTAEFVVSESLKAFAKDKWLAIPGWRYRALAILLRNVPRALLHPMLIRVARRRELAEHRSP
jgi:uncharacterized protein